MQSNVLLFLSCDLRPVDPEACGRPVGCVVHTPASPASAVLARFRVSQSTRCVRDSTKTLHSRYAAKQNQKWSSVNLTLSSTPSIHIKITQDAQLTAAASGTVTCPAHLAPSPTLAKQLARPPLAAHVLTDRHLGCAAGPGCWSVWSSCRKTLGSLLCCCSWGPVLERHCLFFKPFIVPCSFEGNPLNQVNIKGIPLRNSCIAFAEYVNALVQLLSQHVFNSCEVY